MIGVNGGYTNRTAGVIEQGMFIQGYPRNSGDPLCSLQDRWQSRCAITEKTPGKPAQQYPRGEREEQEVLCEGIGGEGKPELKRRHSGSHSLPIVPLVDGEVHSERAIVGKGF